MCLNYLWYEQVKGIIIRKSTTTTMYENRARIIGHDNIVAFV